MLLCGLTTKKPYEIRDGKKYVDDSLFGLTNPESDMKVHRIQAAMAMTGLPRSTIYLYIKNGKFPKAIKLGERSVGWLESDLLEWIQRRINISE